MVVMLVWGYVLLQIFMPSYHVSSNSLINKAFVMILQDYLDKNDVKKQENLASSSTHSFCN